MAHNASRESLGNDELQAFRSHNELKAFRSNKEKGESIRWIYSAVLVAAIAILVRILGSNTVVKEQVQISPEEAFVMICVACSAFFGAVVNRAFILRFYEIPDYAKRPNTMVFIDVINSLIFVAYCLTAFIKIHWVHYLLLTIIWFDYAIWRCCCYVDAKLEKKCENSRDEYQTQSARNDEIDKYVKSKLKITNSIFLSNDRQVEAINDLPSKYPGIDFESQQQIEAIKLCEYSYTLVNCKRSCKVSRNIDLAITIVLLLTTIVLAAYHHAGFEMYKGVPACLIGTGLLLPFLWDLFYNLRYSGHCIKCRAGVFPTGEAPVPRVLPVARPSGRE